VGMTALPITAATSAEYWLRLIIPCDRPKSDEIVPKRNQPLRRRS
jgi:hypothetical protein